MTKGRRRPARAGSPAAPSLERELAALGALGLGPDAALWHDPSLLSDGRLLASVHGRLADALGEREAVLRLHQVGLVHGLRDALHVAEAHAVPPARPVETAGLACLPLAIALAPLPATPGEVTFAGGWPEAVEAAARLAAVGPSDAPVCGVSAGYTAGWLAGAHECDLVVVETACCAAGDPACHFEVREPAAWLAAGHRGARALLAHLPFEGFRTLMRRTAPDESVLREQRELAPGTAVVDIWGPVMVLPFHEPDEALRLVEAARQDPGTHEVRVVVIDLRGIALDDDLGAAALERALETLDDWGAEVVLTGVSPLADRVVADLEARHLVMRKDAPEAIATAFQIAEAQRRAV